MCRVLQVNHYHIILRLYLSIAFYSIVSCVKGKLKGKDIKTYTDSRTECVKSFDSIQFCQNFVTCPYGAWVGY